MRGVVRWGLVLAGLAGVLVTVLFVLVAISYLDFQQSPPGQGLSTGAQVAIGQPIQGSTLAINEAVLVETTASGPFQFSAIELWVDGELAGLQNEGKPAKNSLNTSFFWTPVAEGPHTLVARALTTDGRKFTSSMLTVQVAADAGVALGEPDTSKGTVYPAAQSNLPSPGAPAAGASVPADEWTASVVDWINYLLPSSLLPALTDEGSDSAIDWMNITLSDTPKPTTALVASGNGCTARLHLQDLSEYETGFRLYRHGTNSTYWQLVAVLDGQSASQWISWDDLAGPGIFSYYASAFNAKGSNDSNLVTVELDGTNCPQIQFQGMETISTEVTKFFPQLESGDAYCYYSADGTSWQRWPHHGFITPGASFMTLSGPLTRTIVAGQVGSADLLPMAGFMECWNWQDGGLEELGGYQIQPVAGGPIGEYQMADENGELVMKMKAEAISDPVWPLAGNSALAGFSPDDPELDYLFRPDMPRPWLRKSSEVTDCIQQLHPSREPDDYCYNADIDGQNYLYWSTNNAASECIGAPAIECKDYQDFLSMADATEGMVWFIIHDLNSEGEFKYMVSHRNVQVLTLPEVQCVGSRGIWVEMFYQPGENVLTAGQASNDDIFLNGIQAVALGETEPLEKIPQPLYFQSPPSNMVVVPCPPPVLEQVAIDVTFDSISPTFLDDDDASSVVDLEIFGYVRIMAPALGHVETIDPLFPWGDPQTTILGARRYLNIARWNEQAESCPDDIADKFSTPGQGCTQTINNNIVYPIAEWETCFSKRKSSCVDANDNPTSFQPNQNILTAIIEEGDPLIIEVKFIDWDDASENDLYCEDTVIIDPMPLEEWANLDGLDFSISTNSDSGRCEVNGSISASAQ